MSGFHITSIWKLAPRNQNNNTNISRADEDDEMPADNDIHVETLNNCRLLYGGPNARKSKGRVVFGWECGQGWFNLLRDMSYELEGLNLIMYPKFRCRIDAVQVKEKYGYLEFYHTVVVDRPLWQRVIIKSLKWVSHKILSFFNFRSVAVVDCPKHVRHVIEPITKEMYEHETSGGRCCSNVECVKHGTGESATYARYIHYTVYKQEHLEPTRHKFMYWLGGALNKLSQRAGCLPMHESRQCRVAANFLYNAAEEIVEKYQKKAHDTCEQCGRQLDDRYEPRCETQGWISYVCEDCAAKRDVQYKKLGKLYFKKEEVKHGKDEDCCEYGEEE